jgi:hypothetical protein
VLYIGYVIKDRKQQLQCSDVEQFFVGSGRFGVMRFVLCTFTLWQPLSVLVCAGLFVWIPCSRRCSSIAHIVACYCTRQSLCDIPTHEGRCVSSVGAFSADMISARFTKPGSDMLLAASRPMFTPRLLSHPS